MRHIIILLLFVLSGSIQAQEYYTRTGHVHVKSANKFKNIEADNYQIISVFNTSTGEISFEGLLRSFEFKFGALDRAVNSRNLDVSAHPKIKFKGKVKNFRRIDFNKPGEYNVKVHGNLFIWDEKRVTTADGRIYVGSDGQMSASSNFIMTIEEQSVEKLNDLMRKKLPDVLNINTNTLGVSRDIIIDLDLTYQLKTW
ncbi:MAG: hypothetical protein HKN67_09500 [Saprospiraceae bacterium]|nr:hypothetical protein [Saprospiraceae bacterium]